MSDENGHGIGPEEADPRGPAWVSWGLRLDPKKKKPVLDLDNIAKILELDPNLAGIAWSDEFHQRIFTGLSPDLKEIPADPAFAREWTDVDDIRLTVYMQGELGLDKLSDETVRKAVTFYAGVTRRNEPKEWMESLKWDGQPRVDNFLSDGLGAAPSIYMRAVSKNFWLGLVARIYKPGCQVDNMVVLEGPQGIGKSMALRAIGGKWYLDWSGNIYDKDFYLAFQGKLLIEISELESFSRTDVTKIKSVITCLTDQYRAPYDARSRAHPRQSVFVGTTNEPEWIKDQTGGRRFWPVRCDLIDIPYIIANRDQLFAEAVSRFKEGESWWEMPESTKEEQDSRRVADVWEEEVTDWLKGQLDGLTLAHVAKDCLNFSLDKLNMQDQRRLAQCMRRAGWQKKHTEFGNLWYKMKQITEPSEPSR